MPPLNFSPNRIVASNIADLHASLRKLKLNVAAEEVAGRRLGDTTAEAIKEFQRRSNLAVTGKLSADTLNVMNTELIDVHHTHDKTRTAKLHALLAKLDLAVPAEERTRRLTGDGTRNAIKTFQQGAGLQPDGKISEAVFTKLDEAVIKKNFSTKTQIGNLHNTLMRASKIAKVSTTIDAEEIKRKELGTSTSEAIKALQAKYKLPQTGALDRATLDRIQSVAASRGVRKVLMKTPESRSLRVLTQPVRLNMQSANVTALQSALRHLGHPIAASEFELRTFGKTTNEAVLAFQKTHGLPETGHVEKRMMALLNNEIARSNPEAATSQLKYRVRGSVRDALAQRVGNMVIHVHEKLLDGESATPLVTKKTHANGFFDITYNAPLDKATGQVKEPFHLIVKLLDATDKFVESKLIYDVGRIQWVNFNLGGDSYKGDSEYEVFLSLIGKALGAKRILDVQETTQNRQVTQLSVETGLTTDDLMRVILSHRVAANLNKPVLTPEAVYSFLRQNLPGNLPGDLLRGTNDWQTIDQLTEMAGSGIVFTDDGLLEHTLERSVSENLVTPRISQGKAAILQALRDLRTSFTLDKPILLGNGTLRSLLNSSVVPAQHHSAVAKVFTTTRGVNDEFWKELKVQVGALSDAEVKDLAMTVDLGNITKNHVPTLQFMKGRIGSGAGQQFKITSDIAKLDKAGWTGLIAANGNQVPANMPGTSVAEKVGAYAAVLQARAERLFPVVSLVASVKRSNVATMTKLDAVEQFVDAHPDFNFKTQYLGKFLADNPAVQLDTKTKDEVKIVQRVHKLASDAATGTALVAENLHASSQIYFMGKNRFVTMMEKRGIDPKVSFKVYEQSSMIYLQVLAKLADLRKEIHVGTPQVIIPQTYTKDEITKALGDIPDLETLFGSEDYCDCEHCKSLYGPAAYLADLLRFLNMHNSLVVRNGKTLSVKEVLFDRRPDIGNIKLNCENTNTPLPYIDLVCEILENNVSPAAINFSYQTTLTAKELRAIPQYIRPQAYDTLAVADYPMNSSLNLWQEEARTYLNYLRVPRYELMEAFQDISNPAAKVPSDSSIAAEYFGLSSHEATLVITSEPLTGKQDVYWGIDTTQTSVSVAILLKRAQLRYNELLELLMVRWINDHTSVSRSQVNRPSDTCNVDVQTVTNLTLQKFDQMHRFLRLWRRCGWQMWELDLLIRNPKIGNGRIDGDTLANLKRFKQLQETLALPLETLLAFYADINTEERIRADKPGIKLKPLYEQLFQNQAITNPTDGRFARPLDNAIVLGPNAGPPYNGYTPVPTILSALAIRQIDLDVIQGKTDGHLSEASLSTLFRYVCLARGLKLSLKDLLVLLGITNVSDPFSTIQVTGNLVKHLQVIKASGVSLLELDYLLNYSPDSPIGLRDEAIGQILSALRAILLLNEKAVTDLALDDTKNSTILTFNADALLPMTNLQVLAAIVPLQNLLKGTRDAFKSGSFSIEETEYIFQYDPSKGGTTAVLVGRIKGLQKNLKGLIQQNGGRVIAHFATSFGIADDQVEFLLNNLVLPGQAEVLIRTASDKTLITPKPDGSFKDISVANYPVHFKLCALVHKIALLVQRLKIQAKDLEYFQRNHATLQTLDLSILPLAPSAPPNAYTKWRNLYWFLEFSSKYPEPEDTSLRAVLDKAMNATAPKSDTHNLLAKFTQWKTADLTSLDTAWQLKHQQLPALVLDYTVAELYGRLWKCFAQTRLTGVNADTMVRWAKREDAALARDTATQTRLAVKSKYESADWLEQIRPLQDELRENKRKALVGYLMEYSQRTQPQRVLQGGKEIPNPLYWYDSNALFKYLLIDVEMSACQLTSRIKQAISSIQLFVQRCFLNLENRYVQVSQEEKDDRTSENAWSQWSWMKNYRIWEAHRKVFFYPENWIEPELRDDKSPFFKDLENELMQSEVTHENVEAAYLNYLDKVDEVAHLEVCGLYHQMEDLNLHEDGYEVNIVHVIARTKAIPAIYYYRTYDMNTSSWAAWEKVEVDITGDHVIPVVYNRKLHLFWLVFAEKPQKMKKAPAAQPSNGPTNAPDAAKVLELQLAWTVKKAEGWSTKKQSVRKLIHPWERPHFSYNLKPYYKPVINELWLDIYLSTSREFNEKYFYDEYVGGLSKVTGNPFNEKFLPWHSASFVFDGDVKDIKLKGLSSYFRFEFPFGGGSTQVPLPSTSFDYVHENFGESGRQIKMLQSNEDGPRLGLPVGMHWKNTHLTNNQYHAANTSELRVLEGGATTTLLRGALNPFELVITQQDLQFNTLFGDHPLVYQDSQRAFFIKPEWQQIFDSYGRFVSNVRKYRLLPNYHPYTVLFLRELSKSGLDGLLNRRIQTKPETFPPSNTFAIGTYQPTPSMVPDDTVKKDIVDFSFGGAYSLYNWELFFHAPMLIAGRLSQNQRFEEAQRWFHRVFDPTNIEALPTPQRYWVTKPFYEFNSDDYRKQRIENILTNLGLKENSDQLTASRNNPFKPHLIARYRPVAYQRNVVMKYLDNLIAWGDQLFRRDTIESLNEASLLYMLAYEILGDRPTKVPHVKHEDLTFNELEKKLDALGNARVDVVMEDAVLPIRVVPSSTGTEPLPKVDTFYFCIPNNDRLLTYWDTVEDRLFKIRHCMNIEGLVRQLPLFEPPIDPALLVKAAAAGIDLGSVLNDLSVGSPRYRFRIVVQKAIDFCNDVRVLGEKLLSALEKKEVEGLALLRSSLEMQLLEAVKEIKKKQIDEAVEALGSLNKAREMAEKRKSYYGEIPRMNEWEVAGVILHGAAIVSEIAATISNVVGAGAHLFPDLEAGAAGFGGTPTMTLKVTGGDKVGNSAARFAALFQGLSTILHSGGSLLELQGNYTRKDQENLFQRDLATIESEQLQFQINAAQIRQNIAETELENQELQIDNAKVIDEYMKNKYTNQQLYSWMITKVSSVYFQAYQLAFDMAKNAEKCYQRELAIADSSIIQFGYWDSLKKGLLAGDRLMYDLRRLETAYLDNSKRELEITKNISLAQMAPLSLVKLKETGTCMLSLPEWFFNMDYPGHYMRRIKTVSLSIPCVAGPYTSINCTLALTRSETRVNATLSGGQYAKVDENDLRFKTELGTISSIATSHGQRDSGLFQLNFNDDMYLPFEGTGVISEWQIDLPKDNNYFDFGTISDVILHVSYTARDGGTDLAKEANKQLQIILPDSAMRLFSLKHEFGTEWHKFINPNGGADQELVINLRPELYPFFVRGKASTLKLNKIEFFVESKAGTEFETMLKATNTAYEAAPSVVAASSTYDGVPYAIRDYTGGGNKPNALGEFRLKIRVKSTPAADFKSLTSDKIDDLLMLCHLGK